MSDSMGCDMCRYYSALREPREREDGAVIYGYCFATGTKDYNGNMGKGYAVFVPDSGVCEKFKRIYKKSEKAEESKRQMSLEDLSIERLKSENAALKERLEKAVKDVAERIENALFCEFADDMTFKMASRIEEVIKAELKGGKHE